MVPGITGRLGCLLKALDDKNRFWGTSRNAESGFERMDPTKREDIEKHIKENNIDAVLLLSAISSEKECLKNPKVARIANISAPQALSDATRNTGTKLIYISTDYVYNGDIKGAKNESIHNISPTGLYGCQKFTAERIILDKCDGPLILRISRVFSKSTKENCITMAASYLRKNNNITAAKDQYFSPLLDEDLYSTIIEGVDKDLRGVYNCGGSERISRYEFMSLVKEAYGLKTNIKAEKLSEINIPIDVPEDVSMNSNKLYDTRGKALEGIMENIAQK